MSEAKEDIAAVKARLKSGMSELVKAQQAADKLESQLQADIAAVAAVAGAGPHKIAGREFVFRNPRGTGWRAFPYTPPAPKVAAEL